MKILYSLAEVIVTGGLVYSTFEMNIGPALLVCWVAGWLDFYNLGKGSRDVLVFLDEVGGLQELKTD